MYPDVEVSRVEGEGKAEGLEQVTSPRADEAEATRVSTRWGVVKHNQKRVLADHPTLQTESWRWFWALQNQTFYSPLKTVLNTTKKYTERQQDIHQPQISVLWF